MTSPVRSNISDRNTPHYMHHIESLQALSRPHLWTTGPLLSGEHLYRKPKTFTDPVKPEFCTGVLINWTVVGYPHSSTSMEVVDKASIWQDISIQCKKDIHKKCLNLPLTECLLNNIFFMQVINFYDVIPHIEFLYHIFQLKQCKFSFKFCYMYKKILPVIIIN